MRYLLPLLLLLTACSSGPRITSQNVDSAVRTDTIKAPYKSAMDAVMSAYSAKGFGVERVNESAGLVKSCYKQSGNVVGAKARSQFSAQLTRIHDTATEVRLTMTAERQSMGQWSAVTMPEGQAESMYQDAFGTIRDQL